MGIQNEVLAGDKDLPLELHFGRHARSIANKASSLSRRGDDKYFLQEIRNSEDARWPLTDTGFAQARTQGQWIRENISSEFDAKFVSPYLRAQQTRSQFDIFGALFEEARLRERSWGSIADQTYKEREDNSVYQNFLQDPYYAKPSHEGESMHSLVEGNGRVVNFLHYILSGFADQNLLIVSHGDVMWGIRILMEKLDPVTYSELFSSEDPKDRILNGQVISYSRRNPSNGEVSERFEWMRSVCTNNPDLSHNEWVQIYQSS